MTLRSDAAARAVRTLARDMESAVATAKREAKNEAARIAKDAEKSPSKPAPPDKPAAPALPTIGAFGEKLLACETVAQARRLLGLL